MGATAGAAPYAVGVSVMQPPPRGRGATAGAGAGVVLQPPIRGTKKVTSSSKKLERNRQRHKNRVVSKPFSSSCLQKLSVEPPPTPIRRNSPSASAALPIAPETRAQGTPEAAQHDHQMELELLQLQQHRALSMPSHLHAPAAPLFSSATELRSCSNTTMRGAGAGEYAQLHLGSGGGHQPGLLSTDRSRIRKMCSSGKMPSSSKKSAKHKSRSTFDRHSITFGDLEAVGCSLSTGSTPRGQMAASRAANVINPTRMSLSLIHI